MTQCIEVIVCDRTSFNNMHINPLHYHYHFALLLPFRALALPHGYRCKIKLNSPEWRPILIFRGSFGMLGILNSLLSCSRSNDILAISIACESPFLIGTPLTTISVNYIVYSRYSPYIQLFLVLVQKFTHSLRNLRSFIGVTPQSENDLFEIRHNSVKRRS